MAKKKAAKKKTVRKPKGEKVIQIKCEGSAKLPIEAMTIIQGNLKDLTESAYEKLRSRILEKGFSFPIFIWRCKKKNNIIDGTHRKLVLEKLKEEGWKIPPIPVAYISAKSLKEAKEKLLEVSSSYAKVTMEGFDEFTADLELEDFKDNIDLPNFRIPDLPPLKESIEEDEESEEGDEESPSTSKAKVIQTCPNCGHEFQSPNS